VQANETGKTRLVGLGVEKGPNAIPRPKPVLTKINYGGLTLLLLAGFFSADMMAWFSMAGSAKASKFQLLQ
jgi:hypothetical protein